MVGDGGSAQRVSKKHGLVVKVGGRVVVVRVVVEGGRVGLRVTGVEETSNGKNHCAERGTRDNDDDAGEVESVLRGVGEPEKVAGVLELDDEVDDAPDAEDDRDEGCQRVGDGAVGLEGKAVSNGVDGTKDNKEEEEDEEGDPRVVVVVELDARRRSERTQDKHKRVDKLVARRTAPPDHRGSRRRSPRRLVPNNILHIHLPPVVLPEPDWIHSSITIFSACAANTKYMAASIPSDRTGSMARDDDILMDGNTQKKKVESH